MKPYGYVRKDGEGLFIYGEHQFQSPQDHDLVPVYLHPKEWVNLTDEEMLSIEETTTCTKDESWLRNVTRAIEAKLKEKNT